jgi:hypothetical protein
MSPQKLRPQTHSWCNTIKNLPYLKAVSAELRPRFADDENE